MTATSVQIAALLEEARRRAVDPDEVGRQRLSFAFGNVDGNAFSRTTMPGLLPPAFVGPMGLVRPDCDDAIAHTSYRIQYQIN